MWSPSLLLTLGSLALAPVASAELMLKSSSLNTCQENSGFSASLFDVVFTPNNNSASVDIAASSSIEGNVKFDVYISAYGYQIIHTVVDPCDSGLAGLCPMTSGQIPLTFNLAISDDAVKQIPGIAYNFPDLDATVRVYFNMTSGNQAGESVACVEANVSNGKTIDLTGVKWATAVVSGLALAASAVVSGFGYSNAASHVAANALSLFGYFQSQAIIGLTGVPLPPAAQAWTQDFQWSMGIIRVGFMQKIFTWYQRATGGTPADLFNSLTTVSVQVEKRSLEVADSVSRYMPRAIAMMPREVVGMPRALSTGLARAGRAVGGSLLKRANIEVNGSGSYLVYGIQRVAFRAGIESTNLVMTGLTFYGLFVVFVMIMVAAFKGCCELFAKQRWMKPDTFLEFRNGWLTVLKGILFRVTLIGFPQICILCMWEFTQVDSPAIVVLCVFFFFGMLFTLSWAASKVIRIARRSVAMHRNPAYILFSDPKALNKWGFLYVQFRASAYYYIVPLLLYALVKGMFVAFAQSKGTVQAIAFILIEAAALISASVLRPWMDKKTNSFNIAIAVVNFLNAIFLLIFTDVFDQPPLVTGIVGVVLWILNAVFSLVLLIMLIVTTTLVFFRKNPDTRYQFMSDDRASFMKSQTQLATTTELDALAATARGDNKTGYKSGLDLDDDNDSVSTDSLRRRTDPTAGAAYGAAAAGAGAGAMAGGYTAAHTEPPRSPIDPSVPLFPASSNTSVSGMGAMGAMGGGGGGMYGGPGAGSSINRSPSPYSQHSNPNLGAQYRAQNNASPFRQQTSSPSPWQRGAGYDH